MPEKESESDKDTKQNMPGPTPDQAEGSEQTVDKALKNKDAKQDK